MKWRTGGWTLAEMLVVTAILGILFLVCSQILNSTLVASSLESQRNLGQCQLNAYASRIEHDLQRSCAAGLSWLPSAPGKLAILAIHPQQTGALVGPVTWEPRWICYSWSKDSGQLYLSQAPPDPSFPLVPPGVDRPAALGLTGLQQLAARPLRGKLLGGSVRQFTFALDPGPLTHLTLELEIRIPHRKASEILRIEHLNGLRNRS